MEVILKKDVDNLGMALEMVTVKPGYGRNFLIPQGLAKLATASEKKVHAENLKQRAHKVEKMKDEAEGLAGKLAGLTLKIGAKAGESGKIFGSVNTIQIADALKAEGFDVDRKKISISDDSIKQLGTYEAVVTLFKGLKQTISFEVVED
ncbi:MAG: large subunit ribosomal protein L9 [Ulvibacter sp.]|jgi:large subunit ribosomal protein L9